MKILEPEWIEELRAALTECSVSDRLRLGRRLERGRISAGEARDIWRKVERSREWVHRRRNAQPTVRYPEDLPVAARRAEIIEAIRANRCVIVAGETGSGKTTQLPKMCLEAGLGAAGRIACTQPRRVAALSVSRRIAEELGVRWGEEVGSKIRFSDKTAAKTVIKMMTDGMLLSEIQGDLELSEYDAIIVDEAHERSLNIDFLLGHLRLLGERRPDLKVIISSATIDPAAFSKAFDDAPVIEVSGRMFPVETIYRPLDEILKDEDLTYIEGAVAVVEEIISSSRHGDILVFFPGERDIREAKDLLDGRRLPGCEVLPLFGRLSQGDQQRIFEPLQRRKIILATNIAETSITIPGIRYVVDTGVARISRYSPHTRTQRLPIEPISRSSADQRKGRCGRVAEGVCYRLYSEQEYESRPEFQSPEILRSNLAAVILRMKAFRIGDPETFPFMDPPSDRAIKAGYGLLRDLGAMDEERELTSLGKQLARLPVDPTVGRMLLQSRREHAMREVIVIAAALSAQDPRERPMEKREAADETHRRFVHAESDFLTLLNIWNAYHDECERLSLGQLGKFCRKHFLSFTRMREWRDIHAQLRLSMKELGELRESESEAEYDAIHRSILSGLLANVARKEEGNLYRATHSRTAMLFPGSGLFDRKAEKTARKKPGNNRPVPKTRTPEWIMAAEWVETRRLFARQAGKIDPSWILDLGKHLLKSSVSEPHWSRRSGRVLAKERLLLYGLEVAVRRVPYGKINSEEASEIFIRSALIEEEAAEKLPFVEHNRRVRERVEGLQTRLRRSLVWSLEDRLFDFYRERLPAISSIAELHKLLGERGREEPRFLFLQESDLLEEADAYDSAAAFPEKVKIAGVPLDLSYVYRPGEEEDGITLRVPLDQLDAVRPGMLDWLVPGHLAEKITALLRALPKETRKQLIPIPDKVSELLQSLEPSPRPLTEVLSEKILEKYRVRVRPGEWDLSAIPEHLRPRVAVTDRKDRPLAVSRDWEKLNKSFRQKVDALIREGGGASRSPAWREAAQKWERDGLIAWTFGDLPEKVLVGESAGVPVEAYLGIKYEKAAVGIRLFPDRAGAERESRRGLRFLYEQELGRDLAWLQKNLRDLRKLGPYLATIPLSGDPEETAYHSLCDWLFFDGDGILPLREEAFKRKATAARERMKGLGFQFVELLQKILEKRQELLTGKIATDTTRREVARLIHPDFLQKASFDRLQHYPRYLQAVEVRAQRAAANPQKEAERTALVDRYAKRLATMERTAESKGYDRGELEALRWMLEEFRVSVFAQELGTAMRVSEKKLEEKFRAVEG